MGGGVLGAGCVQEEIRFIICPELLASKLFTECLRPTEALIMVGCERYSNYTGYSSSFKWAGNHEDVTPRDSSGRRMTHIVAIDALRFRHPLQQFNEQLMQRELNKAYAGFYHPLQTPATGVASGNWGCGAYRGEPKLKALLQLMVCAAIRRPLVYCSFGNRELCDALNDMHNYFRQNDVLVNELWATLTKFEAAELAPQKLYEFIYKSLREAKLARKSEQLSDEDTEKSAQSAQEIEIVENESK